MRSPKHSSRSPSEDPYAHQSGMVRIQSSSLSLSSTSSNSETCTTSINISIATDRANCTEDHQALRYSAKTASPIMSRSPTQPAVNSYSSMTANGLPSPISIQEPSPGERRGAPPLQHADQSPIRLSLAPHISFPIFTTGNIIIYTDLSTSPKQWQLHSAVLVRHSTWFARTIREEQATKSESTGPYVYVIKEVKGQIRLTRQTTEENRCRIKRSHEDNTLSSTSIKTNDNIEDAAHETVVKVYDQILGSFYNISPHIITTNQKTATSQAERLIKVAQLLGCVHLISSHIGNALLQYRQSLYKAILADAPRYLLLALALENDFIYAESLIHLIGAYPCWPWPTKDTAIPEEIKRLIARKSSKLNNEVLEVERELLLLTITTTRGVSYAADNHSQFDTWFVVQLFRDTLTIVLRQHDAYKPSLKRGSLFRKIRAGGSRYMEYEEVRRLVQRIMPSAMESVGEDLRILKEFASEIVQDLATNELSLDVEEHKVGWLTCVKVEQEDIPWRAGAERET